MQKVIAGNYFTDSKQKALEVYAQINKKDSGYLLSVFKNETLDYHVRESAASLLEPKMGMKEAYALLNIFSSDTEDNKIRSYAAYSLTNFILKNRENPALRIKVKNLEKKTTDAFTNLISTKNLIIKPGFYNDPKFYHLTQADAISCLCDLADGNKDKKEAAFRTLGKVLDNAGQYSINPLTAAISSIIELDGKKALPRLKNAQAALVKYNPASGNRIPHEDFMHPIVSSYGGIYSEIAERISSIEAKYPTKNSSVKNNSRAAQNEQRTLLPR
ncbi:MAG: hypothetical protein V1822_04090 [Candidatus Micrarchaeota archaeon]